MKYILMGFLISASLFAKAQTRDTVKILTDLFLNNSVKDTGAWKEPEMVLRDQQCYVVLAHSKRRRVGHVDEQVLVYLARDKSVLYQGKKRNVRFFNWQ